MRAVIQRVKQASVTIDDLTHASIGAGLLILLGVEDCDDNEDLSWLVKKIAQMRIFADEEGKMNRDVITSKGEILVVSQFTLHASTKKGNRPSFLRSAQPEKATPLYEAFCAAMEVATANTVKQGVFGADMQVALINDGPVTIIIDSRDRQ